MKVDNQTQTDSFKSEVFYLVVKFKEVDIKNQYPAVMTCIPFYFNKGRSGIVPIWREKGRLPYGKKTNFVPIEEVNGVVFSPTDVDTILNNYPNDLYEKYKQTEGNGSVWMKGAALLRALEADSLNNFGLAEKYGKYFSSDSKKDK